MKIWINIFVTILVAAAVGTSAAAAIGEYSIPEWPANLAADTSGNIWFTGLNGTKLRRITPAGSMTEFPLPSGRSFVSGGGIVVGPDGNIWIASQGVMRSTPTGIMTEFPLPTADVPYGMTVGPDGNIWFTTGSGGWIGRITTSGTITSFYVGAVFDSRPISGIAAGPDGNLWFTTSTYAGIGRITTAGTATHFPVTDAATAEYGGITAGADGNMWFADSGNKRIGRITPAGVITFFSVPSIRPGINNITTGPDGNIWFQEEGSGKFSVMTPDGVLSELALLPPLFESNGSLTNFTTSPDGLIWFTHFSATKIGLIYAGSIATFFPLMAGAVWTYLQNGTIPVTRSVFGTFWVNGIMTTAVYSTDAGGNYVYWTSDGNGIRDHQEYYPPSDVVTFSTPLTLASPQSVFGTTVYSAGTASVSTSGMLFQVPYNFQTTLSGVETLTVPAGTFKAIKSESTLSAQGTNSTQINWVAANVGPVKNFTDGVDTYVLTGTNLGVTTPDVFSYVSPQAAPPVTPNTFTVTGITTAAPISIAGGQYSVNGGAYTGAAGMVSNGSSVTVRPTARVNPYQMQAVVTIGGVTGAFNLTSRSAIKGDFSADGKADILWRNPTTGDNAIFVMNGFTLTDSRLIGSINPAWSVVGVGDFDGDGKSDILWRNTSTGENAIFLMDGFTLIDSRLIGSIDPTWSVVGVGDFDGDGRTDILWRNTVTGDNAIFLMNGFALTDSRLILAISSAWNVVGVGDFDGDGKSDILWRNPATGDNAIFLMNGFTLTDSRLIGGINPAWNVVGVGDFDGNGRADILWRNPVTGDNAIFLMNGFTLTDSRLIGSINTSWNVAGVGDYDGDGKSDILWRNSGTGDNAMFLMNGFTLTDSRLIGGINPAWNVVGQ